MFRKLLHGLFVAGLILVPLPGLADGPLVLKSVNVDLPDSDRMFPGTGADAINNNCLACHSAGMVLNQPSLSKAAWQNEVNKMIHAYKAPVDPNDVTAIVDYLSRIKGTP